MRVLSLFAGMGGFDLGLTLAGFEVVAQVEIEPYCQKILAHWFPTARRYGDIKEVTGEQITRECGPIDLICGGFPCQDISTAGKGAGLDAERSGLWWEMLRLITELKPRWLIIENVYALRARGLDRVIASLETLGYETTCTGIPAAAIGAPHERKRLFVVGYAEGERQRKQNCQTNAEPDSGYARHVSIRPSAPMAHADSDGVWDESGRCCRQDWGYSPFAFPAGPGQRQYDWEKSRTIKSSMGYTIDGLPRKLALRALGNAVVPGIVYAIGRSIMRVERAIAQKSL